MSVWLETVGRDKQQSLIVNKAKEEFFFLDSLMAKEYISSYRGNFMLTVQLLQLFACQHCNPSSVLNNIEQSNNAIHAVLCGLAFLFTQIGLVILQYRMNQKNYEGMTPSLRVIFNLTVMISLIGLMHYLYLALHVQMSVLTINNYSGKIEMSWMIFEIAGLCMFWYILRVTAVSRYFQSWVLMLLLLESLLITLLDYTAFYSGVIAILLYLFAAGFPLALMDSSPTKKVEPNTPSVNSVDCSAFRLSQNHSAEDTFLSQYLSRHANKQRGQFNNDSQNIFILKKDNTHAYQQNLQHLPQRISPWNDQVTSPIADSFVSMNMMLQNQIEGDVLSPKMRLIQVSSPNQQQHLRLLDKELEQFLKNVEDKKQQQMFSTEGQRRQMKENKSFLQTTQLQKSEENDEGVLYPVQSINAEEIVCEHEIELPNAFEANTTSTCQIEDALKQQLDANYQLKAEKFGDNRTSTFTSNIQQHKTNFLNGFKPEKLHQHSKSLCLCGGNKIKKSNEGAQECMIRTRKSAFPFIQFDRDGNKIIDFSRNLLDVIQKKPSSQKCPQAPATAASTATSHSTSEREMKTKQSLGNDKHKQGLRRSVSQATDSAQEMKKQSLQSIQEVEWILENSVVEIFEFFESSSKKDILHTLIKHEGFQLQKQSQGRFSAGSAKEMNLKQTITEPVGGTSPIALVSRGGLLTTGYPRRQIPLSPSLLTFRNLAINNLQASNSGLLSPKNGSKTLVSALSRGSLRDQMQMSQFVQESKQQRNSFGLNSESASGVLTISDVNDSEMKAQVKASEQLQQTQSKQQISNQIGNQMQKQRYSSGIVMQSQMNMSINIPHEKGGFHSDEAAFNIFVFEKACQMNSLAKIVKLIAQIESGNDDRQAIYRVVRSRYAFQPVQPCTLCETSQSYIKKKGINERIIGPISLDNIAIDIIVNPKGQNTSRKRQTTMWEDSSFIITSCLIIYFFLSSCLSQSKIMLIFRRDYSLSFLESVGLVHSVNEEQNRSKAEVLLVKKLFIDSFQSVSHEFGNALNCINNLSEIGCQNVSEWEVQNILRPIRYNSKLIQFLINDILDHHMILQNTFILDSNSFRLDDFKLEILSLFELQVQYKNLKLSFDVQPHLLRGSFCADQNRIQSVLITVIRNAVKYTQKGTIKIEFKELCSQEAHTGFIQVDVSDTGVGLDEQESLRLNDLLNFGFSREQVSKNSLGNGIGGLCVSNLIAIRLSGSMNKGITFSTKQKGKGDLSNETDQQITCGTVFTFFIQLGSVEYSDESSKSDEYEDVSPLLKPLTNYGSKQKIIESRECHSMSKQETQEQSQLYQYQPPPIMHQQIMRSSHQQLTQKNNTRSITPTRFPERRMASFIKSQRLFEQLHDENFQVENLMNNLNFFRGHGMAKLKESVDEDSQLSVLSTVPQNQMSSIQQGKPLLLPRSPKRRLSLDPVSEQIFSTGAPMTITNTINQELGLSEVIVNLQISPKFLMFSQKQNSVEVVHSECQSQSNRSSHNDDDIQQQQTKHQQQTQLMEQNASIINRMDQYRLKISIASHIKKQQQLQLQKFKINSFGQIEQQSEGKQSESSGYRPSEESELQIGAQLKKESYLMQSVMLNRQARVTFGQQKTGDLQVEEVENPIKQIAAGKFVEKKEVNTDLMVLMVRSLPKEVESEEEESLQFQEDIPIERDEVCEIAECLNIKQKQFNKIVGLSATCCVKVLCVDDEPFNHFVMKAILNTKNVKCDTALDGAEAIQKFMSRKKCQICKSKSYRLVMMDLNMPVKNGFEATMAIKQLDCDNHQNPVIVITCSAFIDLPSKMKATAAGSDYFIQKPINQKVLFEVLEDNFLI